MSKGVVLFAYNNGSENYHAMAEVTARRVNRFLDLPVSIVTDSSWTTNGSHPFDKVVIQEPDHTNGRKNKPWYNKGRHQVFDLTPYSDTLLLDVDYLVNSTQLLGAFSSPGDFKCFRDVKWLMESTGPEYLYRNTHKTLWATAVRFQKTNRVEQIFSTMAMVQNHYNHYSAIYRFSGTTFRNDYALTIALKTANGHMVDPADYFWWKLLHVNLGVKVVKEGDTTYALFGTDKETGKTVWIRVSGVDFHMLDKANFLEVAN